MRNAVFQIFRRTGLEAEGGVECLQMALSRQGNGAGGETFLAERDRLAHHRIAKPLAAVRWRHHDPADLGRASGFCGRKDPGGCQQIIVLHQPQMQGMLVLAVDLRIGAFLLHHKDIDPHLQQVVQFQRGEVFQSPRIDPVAFRSHQ